MEEPGPSKLVGKVFASLRPGELTIHLGYRYGLISGPGLVSVPREMVHVDARMPNTRVWVHFERPGEIAFVAPLSYAENLEEIAWEKKNGLWPDWE